MTIENALKFFNRESPYDDSYTGVLLRAKVDHDARALAVKSLQAWNNVTREINELESAKYPSGERIYKEDVLELIQKHLTEVEQ